MELCLVGSFLGGLTVESWKRGRAFWVGLQMGESCGWVGASRIALQVGESCGWEEKDLGWTYRSGKNCGWTIAP